MLESKRQTKMQVERWIRFIVGSEAIILSLLSYFVSQNFIFLLIIIGWTALLSFFSNWSPLMVILWSLGFEDERPFISRQAWIFGRGTVHYIERWTRLLSGLSYFLGGLLAYFISPQCLIITITIGFIQAQGAFSNWCPSLAFMKMIGVKDGSALNKESISL
jgi:hypothetical protein